MKQHSNLQWLERRFRYMDDDILVGSPVYQWILEKGREQDLAQMRQIIVDFVQECFPELVQLAEDVVATVDKLPQLGRLTGDLGRAQSVEQARKILLELPHHTPRAR